MFHHYSHIRRYLHSSMVGRIGATASMYSGGVPVTNIVRRGVKRIHGVSKCQPVTFVCLSSVIFLACGASSVALGLGRTCTVEVYTRNVIVGAPLFPQCAGFITYLAG